MSLSVGFGGCLNKRAVINNFDADETFHVEHSFE